MPDPNGYEDRGFRVRQQQVRQCRDLSGPGRARLRPEPVQRLDRPGLTGHRRALRRRDLLGDAGPAPSDRSTRPSPPSPDSPRPSTWRPPGPRPSTRCSVAPRPSSPTTTRRNSSAAGASTAWPDGSRSGTRTPSPLQAAHQLQPAALRAGIATCIVVRPGGHDFDLWSQALEDSFPWLAWRLGLTPGARRRTGDVRIAVSRRPRRALPVVASWSRMAVSRLQAGRRQHGGHRQRGEVSR